MYVSSKRNIIVANKIAYLLGTLTAVLLAVLIIKHGFSINTPIILALSVFFFLLPILHQKDFVVLGRVLLCVVPTVTTLTAAILAKLYSTSFTDILYYDSRFVLIVLAIVPCLIFDTTERIPIYGTLSIIFLTLLLFDPVHELIGVGYYQSGFLGTSYYTINYFAIICFVALVAGVISQKKVIEDTERLNQSIKNDLIVKNKELQVALSDLKMQNEEVQSQNEQITNQREELYASQEQLQSANLLIEKQKAELQRQVNHMSLDLKGANEELIKQNNNLRQFSYAISHNLRGPIARLMGLAYLAELESGLHKNGMSSTIIDHLKTSAGELDSVIHDLNEVIDLQNAVDQLRRPVDFATSWKEIKSMLHISDEMERKHFNIDFSLAPSVISVNPMINSILFNMVSNAIKYQDSERPLQVNVGTYRTGPYTTLEVKDNGLGINLKRFGKDLFKLYKRFHYHQEGKGLGLYLVKTQAEALNGYVQVESEPRKGSTFKVFIKDPLAQATTDQARRPASLLS